MFRVSSGGRFSEHLAPHDAAAAARAWRSDGANDVEIFREDGSRISLYALEQLIRSVPQASSAG